MHDIQTLNIGKETYPRRAVVVSQLAEQSLPMSEVRSLNAAIGKIYN